MADNSNIGSALNYIIHLSEVIDRIQTTMSSSKRKISLDKGINVLIGILRKHTVNFDKKIMIVGNGGSAAIAIHMIADYANAGKMRTIDFMSPALLTCMANDNGYENVFAKPVEVFARSGDILFAISSSGKSPNILKACEAAKNKGCMVVTFSGFNFDNPLRQLGHLNFYVPSNRYGYVELAHETLLHCILDLFVERKKVG